MKIKHIFQFFIFAISIGFSSCKYKDEMDTVKSIIKISDGVFFLEYEGDYGFDEYLAQGGSKDVEGLTNFITKQLTKGKWNASKEKQMKEVQITPVDFGCSSIIVNNSEHPDQMIFGRNYDWKDCPILIIHTKPDNGYESITTCCLSHIGINNGWEPSGNFVKDVFALAAIYVPMDGMNEKGLYIADLIALGPKEETTAQERGNVSVTTTYAIRMVLDKAANVDEALELLRTHDMHSVIGRAHHFSIADASGKSVAVEWVNNEMYVSESKMLTNHYITDTPMKDDGTYADTENSRIRFASLNENWNKHEGSMNPDEVAKVLQSVSTSQYRTEEWTEGLTVWSAVFEPANQKISYFFRENYNKKYEFELK